MDNGNSKTDWNKSIMWNKIFLEQIIDELKDIRITIILYLVYFMQTGKMFQTGEQAKCFNVI